MIGISGLRIIDFVSLYFNTSVILNTVYEPKYTKTSTVYFNNLSTPDETPKAVAKDYFSGESVFFPKCCPPGMSYKSESRACHKSIQGSAIYEELNVTVNLIQTGLAKCDVIVDKFVMKNNLSRIDGNGSLEMENEVYSNRNFCIDNVVEYAEYYVVRLCKKKDYCNDRDSKDWCLRKCCPDGYNIINYSCKLAYTKGIGELRYTIINNENFGYMAQFILASKLSWRNVLSFEIYRTVGTTAGCINQTKDYFRKLMLHYTIYALVIPGVILMNIVLSHKRVYGLPESAVPIFEKDRWCRLKVTEGEYGYLHSYIPNAILAVANIVLWAKTLRYFLKIKRDLKKSPDSDVYKKKIKSNGSIILKLGIIMGLTCIHTLYYEIFYPNKQVVKDLAVISGVIYYFDGGYFFIIFGMKWKSLKAIWSKLCIFRKKVSNSMAADDTVQSNEITMEAVSEPTQ